MTNPLRENRRGILTTTIGDIRFTFVPDGEIPSKGSEDIIIHVHKGDVSEFNSVDALFDSGTSWALMRTECGYVLQNSTFHSRYTPNRFLLLDPDLKTGDLFVTEDPIPDPDPIGYPLNQVLMIMVLSQGRGMLLHGCGIDDMGAGYLFAGNSGHGKSTMAELWHQHGAVVLNDDRIVVREKDGVLWMYGTPWHGNFKEHSADGLAIQKIFFLSRGNSNTVCPKHGAEAVSMLLTRCFPPLWDKEGMAFTVGFCHRLVEKVPCYELSFVPDSRVVDFVRNI